MRACRLLTLVLVTGVLTLEASAQSRSSGRGQGGIVLRDETPVYSDSEGEEVESVLNAGDSVAGVTTMAGTVLSYQFERENDRIQVLYLREIKKNWPMGERGWISADDIQRFLYECGCGREGQECSPFAMERMSERWNICFEEARDRKLEELQPAGSPAAPEGVSSDEQQGQQSVEQRLRALEDLLRKKLITRDEYDQKRAEILRDL